MPGSSTDLLVEILQEIFLITLRHSNGFYDVFNVKTGPWLIARDPISLYTTALSHTGNHYLDIKFSKSFSTDCPLSLNAKMLDISMIHCRRWGNVVIPIPSPSSARLLEVQGRLNSLSHITIFRQDNSDALNVFDAEPNLLATLSLPALTETKLGSLSELEYPSSLLTELHSLILRSQCSLTKLTLKNVKITQVVFGILDLPPQLDMLDIEFIAPMPEFDRILQILFQRLACPSTNSKHGPFLAQLAHVRICIRDTGSISAIIPFYGECIIRCGILKMEQSHPQVHFHIYCFPGTEPWLWLTIQHIKALRRFKKEGLDIKISVPHCKSSASPTTDETCDGTYIEKETNIILFEVSPPLSDPRLMSFRVYRPHGKFNEGRRHSPRNFIIVIAAASALYLLGREMVERRKVLNLTCYENSIQKRVDGEKKGE
ncbi:hypothetical protein IW261DRAFT_1671964 [Armillaria novae-zelandiae]|uniref:Uncharacterized protein n=1 Tax=Armillaria novae-zelandiae TaxID=153914 RepID=A0AA39NS79_9AGAR|nr:hypothetical protein IW261DRAFT_1671964 [Armillaria novae-zelandiae]